MDFHERVKTIFNTKNEDGQRLVDLVKADILDVESKEFKWAVWEFSRLNWPNDFENAKQVVDFVTSAIVHRFTGKL
jgi:hypothetical protein